MDQSLAHRILVKIGLSILAIALVDLVYINYWVLQNKPSELKGQSLEPNRSLEAVSSPSPSALASAKPSPTASPQASPVTKTETIVQKETQTIVQTAQKEIFIPIGSGSTFSHDYIDLAGLKVSIDTTKYSQIDSVYFEASIWVQDGNGQMFTQLVNETDNHAVWSSELSTSSATSISAASPKVKLDSGAKSYKIQAKTNITAYAAHVENARIHIILK